MIRLKITSSDGGQYKRDFPDQASADAYKADVAATAHWGRPAWVETVVVTPEVRDDQGNVVTPAVTQDVPHAAEYTIDQTDVSAEYAQAAADAIAIATADQRVQQIDWSKITTLAQLKTVLQDLIIARKK